MRKVAETLIAGLGIIIIVVVAMWLMVANFYILFNTGAVEVTPYHTFTRYCTLGVCSEVSYFGNYSLSYITHIFSWCVFVAIMCAVEAFKILLRKVLNKN